MMLSMYAKQMSSGWIRSRVACLAAGACLGCLQTLCMLYILFEGHCSIFTCAYLLKSTGVLRAFITLSAV